MRILGPDDIERIAPGGVFACPRCGGERAYDVVWTSRWVRVLSLPLVRTEREVEGMRCRTCGARWEPLVRGRLNTEQMAEWHRRVARLVATVGVVAGDRSATPGRHRREELDPRVAAARAFLVRRGWFSDDVDAVVGWACEVPRSAVTAIVIELETALGVVSRFVRSVGMEQLVFGLASILAAGSDVPYELRALIVDCGRAAGVERDRVDQFVAVASGRRRIAA